MKVYCVVSIFMINSFVVNNAQINEEDNESVYSLFNNQAIVSRDPNSVKYHIQLDRNNRLFNKLFPENPFFQIQTPQMLGTQTIDPETIPHYEHPEEEVVHHHNPFFQNAFQESSENSEEQNVENENEILAVHPQNPFFQNVHEMFNTENPENVFFPEMFHNTETLSGSENEKDTVIHQDNPFLQNYIKNKNKVTSTENNVPSTMQTYSEDTTTLTEIENQNEATDEQDVVIHNDNPFLQGFIKNAKGTSTNNNLKEVNTEKITAESDPITSAEILIHTREPLTTTSSTTNVPKPSFDEETSTPTVFTSAPVVFTSAPVTEKHTTPIIFTSKPITTKEEQTTPIVFTSRPIAEKEKQTTPVVTTSRPLTDREKQTMTVVISSRPNTEKKDKQKQFLSPTIEETLLRKRLEKQYPELLKFKPITNELEDPDFIDLYLSTIDQE